MICIIDYGVGNLTSIQNMLKKGGSAATISGKPEDVQAASKLILPGMGHFDNCMLRLNQSGLKELIIKRVFEDKAPILGICVGLQMLMRSSEEGTQTGLDWIGGETIRFRQEKLTAGQKIPNMGWLEIRVQKESRLLEGMEDSRFYFAHSYHVVPDNTSDILAVANYGYDYAVALEHENIAGVQFHPEKSHRFGLQLLKNFAEKF